MCIGTTLVSENTAFVTFSFEIPKIALHLQLWFFPAVLNGSCPSFSGETVIGLKQRSLCLKLSLTEPRSAGRWDIHVTATHRAANNSHIGGLRGVQSLVGPASSPLSLVSLAEGNRLILCLLCISECGTGKYIALRPPHHPPPPLTTPHCPPAALTLPFEKRYLKYEC